MENQDAYTQWKPPEFDITSLPGQPAQAEANESSQFSANFFRAGKWAPDGSCALTTAEDRSVSIINLSTTDSNLALIPQAPMTQSAPVLDVVWYPTASSSDPASFCFLASIRDCPVKLLDASSGRLRASYRIVDHRERFIAPHSMAFDIASSKLYCGCEDFIEVFDIHQPGDGTRLPTTPSKKSKEGLKGIISAMAFSPDYSGTYAAGTFSTSPHAIGLFDPDVGSHPVLFLGDVRPGGVTQVQYHPTRPQVLFAASRRSGYIQAWDVRNPLGPLEEYRRSPPEGGTNQRLRFDIDFGGRWLAAGDETGLVSFFDVSHESQMPSVEPILQYQAHGDAVGSIAFHPVHSLALTVSGSRHFDTPEPTVDPIIVSSSSSSDSPDSDSDSDSSSAEAVAVARAGRRRGRSRPFVQDASVKLWDFSPKPKQGDRALGL